MEYTVVIRTLGKAGEKYQACLDSIENQLIKPKKIIVYIAEGYPIPKETIGKEQYVYVKKGMIAQRALSYKEVNTAYILFLDDDVFLSPIAVKKMYQHLIDRKADVISPDVFPNANRSFSTKFKMAFIGKSIARKDDGRWAYKVLRNGGYSYNANPVNDVYESQQNAGPCFFCKKNVFLKIHFEEESWMDDVPYALPDDQVMFYKMYLKGYKVLTLFHSGIEHLDAATTNRMTFQKEMSILYSESRNKLIYWHRFIYLPEKNMFLRLWDCCCVLCFYLIRSLIMIVKFKAKELKCWLRGMRDAVTYIQSDTYKALPLI